MTIKELFEKAENGTLTYEQFEALRGEAKFVDLSEGKYVSKSKYDSDLSAKASEIATLNSTIDLRNTDLDSLKAQLASAGADTTKLAELTESFNQLQSKYASDVEKYQKQLKKQEYEANVREFANNAKFSSQAAKRDFISAMLAKNLTIENGKIIGASDFLSAYTAENADAFVKEAPAQPAQPVPQFVAPAKGETAGTGAKHSLSELMKMKNENPNATITF